MRHPVPPMREDAAALKPRLHHEHDGQQRPRLHMRDRLVTGQAQDRQDVARLLGVHRHTVGRWRARDAAGGLDAWLATYVPTGTPVSLAPAVRTSLEQALRRPEGFASSAARRPWVRRTHGVEVQDQTRYTLVRGRVQAKRQVARPSHTHKPLTPFPWSRLPVQNASGR